MLEEMQRLRVDNRLRPAFDAQFAKDVIDVLLDGGHADDEPSGDILIRKTSCDQAQHVQFTLAERFNQ